MKKWFLGIILMALVLVIPLPMMAEVDVNINISLPPPIEFTAPPSVVVIPETYVYVDPDINADLFFWDGFWWRLWEGRWYRSGNYDRNWSYYREVPLFYRSVPRDWRNNYREHRWGGRPWEYKRMPHQQVEKNWSRWEKDRYWEKQGTWYVKGLKPREQKRLQQDKNHQLQRQKQENQLRRQKEHKEQTRKFQGEKKKPPKGRPQDNRPREKTKEDRGRAPERGEHGR